MLAILNNQLVRTVAAATVGVVTVGLLGTYVAKRLNESKKAAAESHVSSADREQRQKLTDEIKFLSGLMAKQREKRPMFLNSGDALRTRYLIDKVTYSYVGMPELETILVEIKSIYDGAEKRT